VLLVVLNHAGLGVPGGFVGVDVFFVISGFLITQQLLRERARTGRISFPRFYARRARRIMPAGALVIVMTTLASWVWLSPLRVQVIARDAIWAALSVINLVLARDGTDYFRASDPPSPFQHYWSLAVEEQFYLVWPILIAFAAFAATALARLRARSGPRVAGAAGPVGLRTADRPVALAILAVAGSSFALSVIVTARSAPWAYFGGHTRIWELAVGALGAVWGAAFGRLRRVVASLLTWLGLAGILAAALLLDGRVPFPGTAALLPVLATACVVAGGCAAPPDGAELLLGRAPLRMIGRLSYSWYLWHWPLLQIWPQATGRPLTTGQRTAAVLLSLLLAAITYQLVEKPVRSRPALVRRPLLGIWFGASCIAAVCATSILAVLVVTVPGAPTAGPPRPLAGPTVDPTAALERALTAELARQSEEPGFAGVTAGPLTPLIERSLRVDQLPSDLTPSLSTAENDDRANTCLAMFAQAVPTGCVVGDPRGPTTVVLFGDSHAGQWSAPLDAIGKERHWQVVLYTKADCPPAPYRDYFEDALDRTYTECDTWRAAVLKKIAELRPNLVVVGSEARDQVANQGTEVMAGLVRNLRATGAKVAFIRDTPYPGFNVLDCLAQHPSEISACVVSIAASKLTSLAREIDNRGARDGGALLIDPAGWLCTADGCPLVIGNALVYRDWSHLSDTYARLLAPYLGPALDAALHSGPDQEATGTPLSRSAS
jgi:peptidoglycan/LPS O-acetylase OafA/YrhL